MKDAKNFAVFGLGRYGMAVAKELVENAKEVIAVDLNPKTVDEASAYIPICKCADVTEPEVIERLGISNIDTVIICMASNLEASVMAITLCKEAGVNNVIVKCANETHRKILLRVGADRVVFPENESGIRLAKSLSSSNFMDLISLSKDVSVVEIDVREEWIGKNLIELNLRKKYSFNVVAIIEGENINVTINPEQPLSNEMKLIVIANTAKLSRLK